MVTEAETVAGVLRGLAERGVGCPGQAQDGTWLTIDVSGKVPHPDYCGCGGTGTGLDPRFSALRDTCERMWRPMIVRTAHSGHLERDCPGYNLRTDLGSIVEAAVACGLWMEVFEYNGRWRVVFRGPVYGEGISERCVEEAAAQALRAAVEAGDA